jgi:hypothetical protein
MTMIVVTQKSSKWRLLIILNKICCHDTSIACVVDSFMQTNALPCIHRLSYICPSFYRNVPGAKAPGIPFCPI